LIFPSFELCLFQARIEEAGGWVSDGRVFGVLQPSRSIGDQDIKRKIPPPPLNRKAQKELKKHGLADDRQPSGSAKNVVIAVPFVSSAVFPANEVLVAGSDGLFDVIPAKSCVKIARAALAAGTLSRKHCAGAVHHGSGSQISRRH
jgi:serine/threonine protein phosphatase PrpC